MTLEVIHQLVRDGLQKGTTLDSIIPSRVRMAARRIEQNWTFQYMRRFGDFTIAAGERVIDAPSQTFKTIEFVRGLLTEGSANGGYFPIVKADPQDMLGLFEGRVAYYWLDGTERMVFDKTSDEDLDVEIGWVQYTSWPTDTSATNWLIENAEDLLLAQSMLNMAIYLRDPRMVEIYKGARDEATMILQNSDVEMTKTNAPVAMQFTPMGGIDDDDLYRAAGALAP